MAAVMFLISLNAQFILHKQSFAFFVFFHNLLRTKSLQTQYKGFGKEMCHQFSEKTQKLENLLHK